MNRIIKGCLMLTAFVLLLHLTAFKSVDEPDARAIRRQLVVALDQAKTADSLYKSLSAVKNKSPLVIGFIGTAQALRAKHAFNPYYKLKYLNNAEKSFQQAVSADPHNIEIRFMRFSVEHSVPGFLGYTKNLNADRLEMISQINKKYYATADRETVTTIINFLITSKRCTAAESENLQKHLSAL